MVRLCSLVALALLACGGEDTTESADATPPSVDANAIACTHMGITPDTQDADRDDELGVLFYTATSGAFPSLDRLTFDFYFPFGAMDGPHDLVFDGENLKDCHTCLTARRDCEAARCSDGKAFLVQQGTASISALGGIGTAFQGSISNAVFAEVSISAADLETTVIPGGETWCIDRLDFDATITAP